ncbi:nitrile hydratase accessory protein [Streptomyces sp. NBC_00582]|uniref:nitrile hydratase accessory protein n=1 Tax=Streptomyces sp. NBC_00582 TaxID=2975783 RepID=UPI0010633FCA|nr:nitrile hydratase accessory protein [Streptomyces sp. NBC_00582]WUB64932.1 nitrile hydratase accessory protein [Streptomyces sp. NBC_00582]
MTAAQRPDTGAADADAARRRVEDLVCGLPGADRPFDAPWEPRAFALAVAAHQGGHYAWSEFQETLIESIRRWEREPDGEPWSYYAHWLEALESVLAGRGTLSRAGLAERTRTVLSTPRDAGHHRAHRDPVAVSPADLPAPP